MLGMPNRSGGLTQEITDQFHDWERHKSPYLFERRMKIALPHLPTTGLVLDVGCGDAAVIEHCRQHRPNLDFIGIDIRPLPGEETFLCADCRALPFADETFDCVLMLAVIEHVPDQRIVLAETQRILRRGGVALITTPNPLYGLAAAIAGRLGLKYREGYDNSISLEQLSALAVDVGLRVDRAQGFVIAPFDNPLGPLEQKLGRHPLARRLLLNQFLKASRYA